MRKTKTLNFFIICGLLVATFTLNYSSSNEFENIIPAKSSENNNFLGCMNSCLEAIVFSDLEEFKDELINFLSNYRVSVFYESLNDNFKFKYNENEVYFAASLIKLLVGLYIYDMVSKDLIDLDKEIRYESRHSWTGSEEMSKLNVGTMVSLRDLVKFSTNVSDNTAHKMLFEYIGYNTLREYARSIGITTMLSTNNSWGNISAVDANILLRQIHYFIENNEDLGREFKNFMINDIDNILSLATDYPVAHKFGLTFPVFHNIGIVYHETPYIIIILTKHSKDDYETIINDIHKKIIELHNKYLNIKKTYCLSK